MLIDALRGYLQLASGLTDVTRDRAKSAAKAVVAAGGLGEGATAMTAVGSTVTSSVSSLADDLMAASKTNRALLTGLIKSEVDRAVSRLGLATRDELSALSSRVTRVERGAGASAPATGASRGSGAAKTPAVKKPIAKKNAAKKTAAKKPVAKQAARSSGAKTAVATPVDTRPSPEQAAPTTAVPNAGIPASTAVPVPDASRPDAIASTPPAPIPPGEASAADQVGL